MYHAILKDCSLRQAFPVVVHHTYVCMKAVATTSNSALKLTSCKAKLVSLVCLLLSIKSWVRNSCKRDGSEEAPLLLFHSNVNILLTNCLQEPPNPCIKPMGMKKFSCQRVKSYVPWLSSREAAGNELINDLTLPHRPLQCIECYITLGPLSIYKFEVSCLKHPKGGLFCYISVHIYLIETL